MKTPISYNRYLSNLRDGETARPRMMSVQQQVNVHCTVPVGITFRRKGDNPLIGFAEGLMFLAQIESKDIISRVAPNANLDLFGPVSFYGPRVGNQFEQVIDELWSDPHSRRAVVTLVDREEPIALRPCTTSLQFVKHPTRSMLSSIITMRSSDAIWGLPYDIIQFSIITTAIARCVGCVASHMALNLGNAHVYEKVWDTIPLKDYTPWEYVIPCTANTLVDWQNWALCELEVLDYGQLRGRWMFQSSGEGMYEE